jgi:hypothetical protein
MRTPFTTLAWQPAGCETIVAVLGGDGSADQWKAIDRTMKRAGRALG